MSEKELTNDLKLLIRNRGSIKHRLTCVEKYINTIKSNSSYKHVKIAEVEYRHQLNEALLSEFEKVQVAIEAICSDDQLSGHYEERENFTERYIESQMFLSGLIQEKRQESQIHIDQSQGSQASNNSNDNSQIHIDQSQGSQASNNSNDNLRIHIDQSQGSQVSNNLNDNLSNILLPKIKLPTFNGDFDKWLTFKNSFHSIISDNVALNENQKFQFLKAALENYALRLIESSETFEKPFQKAWQILCDRFDKRQFLLDTHFKHLVNIPQLNKQQYVQFRQFLDETSKHLTALDGLEIEKSSLYDSLLIHILMGKLDKNTLREWKELKCNADLPTLSEFLNFLKDKADLLHSLDEVQFTKASNTSDTRGTKYHSGSSKPHYNSNPSQIQFSFNDSPRSTIKCNCCKGPHSIYKCDQFLSLTIPERWQKVKQLNICHNCLRTGHDKNHCTLTSCRLCRNQNHVAKHNSLLHEEKSAQASFMSISKTSLIQKTELELDNYKSEKTIPAVDYSPQILLSTIVCHVKDVHEQFHPCRALLDCGAQSNLITETFCNKMKIPTSSANLSIIGINQVTSHLNKKCDVTIYSRVTNYKTNVSCFVVPVISKGIPNFSIKPHNLNLPDHVKLADPEFQVPREVDMLIGAGHFWELLLEGKIRLGLNMLGLQNTQFGYVATGSIPLVINTSICNFSKAINHEDEQLRRFWELEECSTFSNWSKDELECEKQFKENTIRLASGQFMVKFPLKHSPSVLGNSKDTAIKQFRSLEKRFSNSKYRALYFDFLHEYERLGHMTKLLQPPDSVSYYLPHHGILREDHITTKMRVVFNGSSPTSSGWSLNDIQFIGPKVQNDIINILLRFRTYTYVVSADVSMMYRMIAMHPEHKPLQQIVFRESPDDEFSVYQLNTVTYGTSSAPYIAIKCLQQLGIDNLDKYPSASKTILNDFYVDDLLTGSNDANELRLRCQQIDSILKTGQFTLRKWISNDHNIISNFQQPNISNAVISLGENEGYKTLGLQWLPKSDNLRYTIKSFNLQSSITKRHILSIISQIYDPLGLLSPTIIISKIIIQKLWSLKIQWDSRVPPEIENGWIRFQNGLTLLNQVSIPRNTIANGYKLVDIHCFCDASTDAYAAAIYVRSSDVQGNYHVQLLCSKTKVAPLKTISIPRLELCACLLGAQLINSVQNALSLGSSTPLFLWSDSQVALSWINTEPGLLQVFVSNRVSKIQSLTNINHWRYVNTKNNPADLASRGVNPRSLLSSTIWWTGPQFLKYPISEWPLSKQLLSHSQLPELKKKTKIFHTINNDFDLFSKYSNITTLKRVTAYCLRFSNNIRRKGSKYSGPLSVKELDKANLCLIRLAQKQCFKDEFDILSKNQKLDPKHKLSSLVPFIDNDGILRVGGRLRNTHLAYHVKHPILLHSNHQFTKLIFQHKHKTLLHPGPQLLLSSIREFYWPIGGLNLAKRTIRSCIICFKFNPQTSTCPMSALPDSRVKPSLPFQITGIDYAGPFMILDKKGRGGKLTKCWLSIFVCFCTKAVHLEVITDLTSESFLACLKRFISRRGIPSMIYSDNGATFIGAHNELKDFGHFLHQTKASIVNSTSDYGINWKFIPPYTPNHGGLWEAAVKSTKHHLKRVLINNNLTFQEFSTLIIQIEGILNSRPLFAMSNDPHDLNPITPAHFLIGRPIQSIPEPDFQDISATRLSRLQHVQQLYQQFWAQFSKQYISQLHQQYKWKESSTPEINVGTMVLVKKDTIPPYRWPLGRINKLIPSKDGITRLAEVRTSSGTITRSIRHLCVLPNQANTMQ